MKVYWEFNTWSWLFPWCFVIPVAWHHLSICTFEAASHLFLSLQIDFSMKTTCERDPPELAVALGLRLQGSKCKSAWWLSSRSFWGLDSGWWDHDTHWFSAILRLLKGLQRLQELVVMEALLCPPVGRLGAQNKLGWPAGWLHLPSAAAGAGCSCCGSGRAGCRHTYRLRGPSSFWLWSSAHDSAAVGTLAVNRHSGCWAFPLAPRSKVREMQTHG